MLFILSLHIPAHMWRHCSQCPQPRSGALGCHHFASDNSCLCQNHGGPRLNLAVRPAITDNCWVKGECAGCLTYWPTSCYVFNNDDVDFRLCSICKTCITVLLTELRFRLVLYEPILHYDLDSKIEQTYLYMCYLLTAIIMSIMVSRCYKVWTAKNRNRLCLYCTDQVPHQGYVCQ